MRFAPRTILSTLALLALVTLLYAEGYQPPMRIPVSLSANFAEPRPNHLHSGIDLRCGGKEGEPVYACAQGHVVRVVVRPDGYGKALYLQHPSGEMTVYAHLQGFEPAIAQAVQQEQYRRQAFEIDWEPSSSSLLPVVAGQLIGYAGNSGSSSGAHLHFEVRDKQQNIINVLQGNFLSYTDKTPPSARNLYIYMLEGKPGLQVPKLQRTLTLKQSGGTLRVSERDTLSIQGPTFFGLDMLDRMEGTQSIFGIYQFEVKKNEESIFSFKMDRFSFAETRYINSMLDYEQKVLRNQTVLWCYRSPGNKLSVIQANTEGGLLALKPGEVARISMRLKDDKGNTSTLQFWVQQAAQAPKTGKQTGKVLDWRVQNTHVQDNICLTFPAGSLYQSTILQVVQEQASRGVYSGAYRVMQPYTPPHKAIKVRIKTDSVPVALQSKLCVVCVDKKGNKSAQKTTYTAPYAECDTRELGTYVVMADTVAPVIVPVNFVHGGKTRGQRLSIRIKDDLAGVASYTGRIDGAWALWDYDPKNEVMHYDIDTARVRQGEKHVLQLEATDRQGNRRVEEWEVEF